MEKLCKKRLLVNTQDNDAARLVLSQNGIIAIATDKDLLEIQSAASISNPETIATLLVNNQVPPSLLSVVEEDLESYFLRTIGEKGESL